MAVFRLIQQNHPDHIDIIIEGDLQGDSVGIAESVCLDALLQNPRVTLLIRNVTEIDIDGRQFLRRMAAAKAQLRAVGIYSQYVIKKLSRSKPKRVL